MNEQYIPIREACAITGINHQTIRKWVDSGKIKHYKTPSNQRMLSKQSVLSLTNNIHNTKKQKQIIYCRVSSPKQKDDLIRQCDKLQDLYPNHEIIKDIGSGINWQRKGLKTILECAMSGELKELVVAHKDRLSRFGYELVEWIIKSNGGAVTVLDEEMHTSTEQELAEDLLSIVHIYSCKQMGKRRYNKDVTNKNLSDFKTKKDIKELV